MKVELTISDAKISAMIAALVEKRLEALTSKVAALETKLANLPKNPVGRPQFTGTEKTCSICHETKPVEDFYAHQGRCKKCFVGVTTKMHREKRLSRLDMIRAADERVKSYISNVSADRIAGAGERKT